MQQCSKQEVFGERQDPRLDSFIHYLVANELNIDLYRRALLEQVALQEFEMQGEVGRDCKCDVTAVTCQLCFH